MMGSPTIVDNCLFYFVTYYLFPVCGWRTTVVIACKCTNCINLMQQVKPYFTNNCSLLNTCTCVSPWTSMENLANHNIQVTFTNFINIY